jgi:hypothetical protein
LRITIWGKERQTFHDIVIGSAESISEAHDMVFTMVWRLSFQRIRNKGEKIGNMKVE